MGILRNFRNFKNNPLIPFLGIYLEKAIIQKDTCIPMFNAAIFTIAKT